MVKFDYSFKKNLKYCWWGECWLASDGTIIPVTDSYHFELLEALGASEREVFELGYWRVGCGVRAASAPTAQQLEAIEWLFLNHPEETNERFEDGVFYYGDTREVPRPMWRI